KIACGASVACNRRGSRASSAAKNSRARRSAAAPFVAPGSEAAWSVLDHIDIRRSGLTSRRNERQPEQLVQMRFSGRGDILTNADPVQGHVYLIQHMNIVIR